MATPRQLSRQWCDFWLAPIRLVKLAHAKQVTAGESPQARLFERQIVGQLIDHAMPSMLLSFWPLLRRVFDAQYLDHLADDPVNDNVVRMHNHFPRAAFAADSVTLRLFNESISPLLKAFIEVERGPERFSVRCPGGYADRR